MMEFQQGKNIIQTAVVAFLEKADQPFELMDSYHLTTSINFENVIYNIQITENKTHPVISIWYTWLANAQSPEKMTRIVNELNRLGPGKFVYSGTGAIDFGWDFLMPSYDITADEFQKYFDTMTCPPKRSPIIMLVKQGNKGGINGQENLHSGANHQ